MRMRMRLVQCPINSFFPFGKEKIFETFFVWPTIIQKWALISNNNQMAYAMLYAQKMRSFSFELWIKSQFLLVYTYKCFSRPLSTLSHCFQAFKCCLSCGPYSFHSVVMPLFIDASPRAFVWHSNVSRIDGLWVSAAKGLNSFCLMHLSCKSFSIFSRMFSTTYKAPINVSNGFMWRKIWSLKKSSIWSLLTLDASRMNSEKRVKIRLVALVTHLFVENVN